MFARLGDGLLDNLLAQATNDLLNRLVDMGEELLPAPAQVIQTGFAVLGANEAVFGAFTEAGELVVALAAAFG